MRTTIVTALAVLVFGLHILAVCGDSQRLLEAWKKITINYANDIEQSYNIYTNIREEQQALDELRTIVERHLRTKNAELLANAINSNDNFIAADKLRSLVETISNSYSHQLLDGIIAQAMDESIVVNKLPQIPDILWHIYDKNDSRSFENMLLFQIRLYWSFSGRQHNDEQEFLQNYAYLMYKIQDERLYNSVSLYLKSNVQNIINKLPNNLKYLYFTPHFCLQNVKYEKYIYTAIEAKLDAYSRYIWLWNDSKSMDDTGYIKAQVSKSLSNDERKFYVTLKGTKYQMYYYLMDSSKKVAGWNTVGTPANYIWELEFLDNNRVAFSQNDKIMCAVELHDNERRNVGGRKKTEVSSSNPECQWFLGACIFK